MKKESKKTRPPCPFSTREVRGRFTTKTVKPMGRSKRGSYFFLTARKIKVNPMSHITTWPRERFEKPVWEKNDTISVMMVGRA